MKGATFNIYEGSVDPVRDVDIIRSELALKDIETIEKKLRGLKKEVKQGNADAWMSTSLEKWLEGLNSDVHIIQQPDLSEEEVGLARFSRAFDSKASVMCC